MKVAPFSAKPYDVASVTAANASCDHELEFFEDRSAEIVTDDVFARLMTFPNVLVTAHQAFLTHEALNAIATITLQNPSDLEAGRPCPNAL